MANIIEKKSVLKIFYYLIAIDGKATEDELSKFNEIGLEICGDDYSGFKDELIISCELDMSKASDNIEKHILKCVDQALESKVGSIQEGMVPRLLLWNLLVIANSDNDYAEIEKRFIYYISEKLGTDKSVVLEMEHHLKAAQVIEGSIKELENSSKPYNEIRPLVDQAETRRNNILTAIKTLIEDEIIIEDTEIIEKANLFSLAGKKIEEVAPNVSAMGKKVGEAISPKAKEAGIVAGKIIKNSSELVGEKAILGLDAMKTGAGVLFDKIKDSALKPKVVYPKSFKRKKMKAPPEWGLSKTIEATLLANDETSFFLLLCEVEADVCMDFDHPEGLIDDLHNSMDEHKGIIEVKSGTMSKGGKYVYYILKHDLKDEEDPNREGTGYQLNFNFMIKDKIFFINGEFTETANIGLRKWTVYDGFVPSDGYNTVEELSKDWSGDPYDKSYTKGYLMDMSEREDFDEKFMGHALTLARAFVHFIIESN